MVRHVRDKHFSLSDNNVDVCSQHDHKNQPYVTLCLGRPDFLLHLGWDHMLPFHFRHSQLQIEDRGTNKLISHRR